MIKQLGEVLLVKLRCKTHAKIKCSSLFFWLFLFAAS